MGPFVTGAERTTAYSTSQVKFRPGHSYFDEAGQEYRFIKYDQGSGSVAGTQGLFVCRTDSTHATWECTADLDDADALAIPVGQLQATLSNGQFGFAMKNGRNRYAVTTDGTITAGCIAKLGTGDGDIVIWSSGVAIPVGVSEAADDATPELAIGELNIFCP